jgi:hypothetical protein
MVGGITAALVVGSTGVASAGTVSHLLVTSPSTPISITYSGSHDVTVTLKLDNNCPTVFGNQGQDYGIAAVSDAPAVATVSPASRSGLTCSTVSSFVITGVANGGATVRFDPVAKNRGLQKKLAGVSVNVTVSGFPTDGNGGNPPGHKRPAAPAVANAYLTNPALVSACKTAYATSGHHWRGALIRTVAKWSATNHLSTKKDNTSIYPTDNDWIQFVQAKVNTLCGY